LKKKWLKSRRQVAALPYRFDRHGDVEVLLITSRETRRWVVPKGWPMPGRKPHRAAEREAYEEAGLKGRISKNAVGTYEYGKRLDNGMVVPCEVSVFPLHVTEHRNRWPEQGQRELCWCKPQEAADRVQEDSLRRLLCEFAPVRILAAGGGPCLDQDGG
jgi:8-oxo-dGTP pyrophosphatase MutT (NUDIX family)